MRLRNFNLLFNPFDTVRYDSEILPDSRALHTTFLEKITDTFQVVNGDAAFFEAAASDQEEIPAIGSANSKIFPDSRPVRTTFWEKIKATFQAFDGGTSVFVTTSDREEISDVEHIVKNPAAKYMKQPSIVKPVEEKTRAAPFKLNTRLGFFDYATLGTFRLIHALNTLLINIRNHNESHHYFAMSVVKMFLFIPSVAVSIIHGIANGLIRHGVSAILTLAMLPWITMAHVISTYIGQTRFGLFDYATLGIFRFIHALNIMLINISNNNSNHHSVVVSGIKGFLFISRVTASIIHGIANNLLRPGISALLTMAVLPPIAISHVIATSIRYLFAHKAAKEVTVDISSPLGRNLAMKKLYDVLGKNSYHDITVRKVDSINSSRKPAPSNFLLEFYGSYIDNDKKIFLLKGQKTFFKDFYKKTTKNTEREKIKIQETKEKKLLMMGNKSAREAILDKGACLPRHRKV